MMTTRSVPGEPRTWIVETPLGTVAVWDAALQARGYPADDAGAVALAHDLIDTGCEARYEARTQ